MPAVVNEQQALSEKIDVQNEAAKWQNSQPTWVNYTRVLMDLVMVGVLLLVVIGGVQDNKHTSKTPLHIHEVPIYLKHDLSLGPMWTEAFKTDPIAPQTKLGKFKIAVAESCTDSVSPLHLDAAGTTGGLIGQHPMCMCIAAAPSERAAKNCLLSLSIPSQNSDWNTGAFASAMVLWFLASLAASIGTLPFASTYLTWHKAELTDNPNAAAIEGTEKPTGNMVYTTPDTLVALYIIADLFMLAGPLIVSAVQFPQSPEHLNTVFSMMTWSLVAIVTLGLYNWTTVWGYMTYHITNGGMESRENYEQRVMMTSNNWVLYIHLLVSAPAIAMVLHLTQQWTEYHTIVNTTLIFSAIFAVDAFSSEMANYWLHHTYVEEVALLKGGLAVDATVEKVERTNLDNLHTTLGMIRLFAIVVNAVLLMLLFTLAYPIQIDEQKTQSAVYVIVVIAYASVFLVPDLVREFTQRMSFNAIQFRQYGDFVVRALTLFFVWRASVYERS